MLSQLVQYTVPLLVFLATTQPTAFASQHPLCSDNCPEPIDTDEARLVGQWVELARRYAPVIYLAKDESFYPSSASYFIPAMTLLNERNLPDPSDQPSPLFPSYLSSSSLPAPHGASLHLAVNFPPSPSPSSNPYDAQPTLDPTFVDNRIFGDKDGSKRWEVVCFAVEKSEPGVVDLYYWTYYPYNFGKRVGLGLVLGNHISDWETMMVRTVDGEAVSVDYLAHVGDYGWGTSRWEDVPKEDGRPVAFSARGSHGLWPITGEIAFASVFGVFKIIDSTSHGERWDTLQNLTVLPYYDPPSSSAASADLDRRRRHHPRGDSSWLNYRGLFGDLGDDNCRFPICSMVDGPPGPFRESMTTETPRCVIASALPSSSSLPFFLPRPPAPPPSSYTFKLSPALLSPFNDLLGRDQPLVGVEQICERNDFVRRSWSVEDEGRIEDLPRWEDEARNTHNGKDVTGREKKAASEEAIWGWAIAEEVDEDGWSEVNVPACRKGWHVAAYRTVITSTPSYSPPHLSYPILRRPSNSGNGCSECSYLAEFPRKICAYPPVEPALGAKERKGMERGEVRARSVRMKDLDWWMK